MNVESIEIYNEILINNKLINDANKLIYTYNKNNRVLTKKLFYTCNHEWIYDECASFDDKCKYICKFCKLYRNPNYN